MEILKKNTGLYLDYYELTMAQGYFLNDREKLHANFDYYFRSNPFKSGYTIFAGLQDLLELIQNFKYDSGSIDYLHKLGFHSDFLEYLKNFSFKGKVYAPNEGEIVFPNEPVVRCEGNIIETQLLETLLLNILNFQSLIATKASRVRYSAGKRMIVDFGMRRAQGLGGIHASKAAIIGGVNNTSNVYSAYLYGLTPTGTQAHSWIQSFEDELTAFRKFAELYPDNCILLVDTFDTLNSGIPNAITVAKEMENRGKKLLAIRLDSGDLAYLSKQARKMLDDAGLTYVKIVVSNQLDEYLIKSLIEQGAQIDSFGIGTNLITGKTDAALDGVYKLSICDGKPGIKLSEDIAKITLPGIKKIFRYFNSNGKFYADGIALEDEVKPDIIYHPHHPFKKRVVKDLEKENLLSKVYEDGNIIIKNKSVNEIAGYVKSRLEQLPEEHKRFEFPHIYKVGISSKLMNLRDELIKNIKGNYIKGKVK